ncbi:HIT family protein [Bacillus sp. J37]|uniref:HIT family protein n=1 Tax=Bacillus sp. J37 TaxID=935837 RepID=UPI0004B6DC77
MSVDWKKDRFRAIERGENPLVIAKMKSGYAVIGDTQFLPGYCVLLAYPKVDTLNDLTIEQRGDYLVDMSLIGDAIQSVCNPRRLNYSMYGNSDAFLHAHIFPRYEWEPEDKKPYPVWQYGDLWNWAELQYSEEKHGELRKKIKEKLIEIMKEKYDE